MSSCYFLFQIGKDESKQNKDFKNLELKSSTELSSEENQTEVTREKDSPINNFSPDNKTFLDKTEVNLSSNKKEANKLLNKKRYSHEKQSKTLNLIPNKVYPHHGLNSNNNTNSPGSFNDINKLFNVNFPCNSGSSLELENLIEKGKIIEPQPSLRKNEEIKSHEEKRNNKETLNSAKNLCFPEKFVAAEKEKKSIKIEENDNTPNQSYKRKDLEKIESKNNNQTNDLKTDIKKHILKSVIVNPSLDREAPKNSKKTVFNMIRIDNNNLNQETSLNGGKDIQVNTSNQFTNSNPFFKKDTNKSSNQANISSNNKSLDSEIKGKKVLNKMGGSEKDNRADISNLNFRREKEIISSDQTSSKKNTNLKKENFSSNNNNNLVKPIQNSFSYNYNSNAFSKGNSNSVLSQLLSPNPLTINKDNEKSNAKNVLEDYFLNNSRKEIEKEKEKDIISKDNTVKKNKIVEKKPEKNVEKNLNPKTHQANKNRPKVEKEKKFKLRLRKDDLEIIKKDPLKHKSLKDFYRNSLSERFLDSHINKSNKKKLKFLKKFVVQKEKQSINKSFYSLYSRKYSKRRISNFTQDKINYLLIKLNVSDNEEKTILSSVNLANNIFKGTKDD